MSLGKRSSEVWRAALSTSRISCWSLSFPEALVSSNIQHTRRRSLTEYGEVSLRPLLNGILGILRASACAGRSLRDERQPTQAAYEST